MKRYGYHRTSTKEQHLDRGITEINEYCSANNLELEKIFTDQQTGKNFNRPRYIKRKTNWRIANEHLTQTNFFNWLYMNEEWCIVFAGDTFFRKCCQCLFGHFHYTALLNQGVFLLCKITNLLIYRYIFTFVLI